ncbi:MAG TPA: amidohydrolase family protein [Acidimicrobiales bacterium]|nr:amidohydrolase family protein [Acidimicrobiales bacterium]
MTVQTITASTVVTPLGVLEPGQLSIDNGTIVDVRASRGTAPERILCPGFVDLQVNGHDDVHVALAEGADWERLDQLLLSQGVTGWCPTLTTAPLAGYSSPLERIASARTRPGIHPAILGAHLEGPFLGGATGAHRKEHVLSLDRAWLHDLPAVVRVVTLAPELDEAPEAVADLTARNIVVALGHSHASFEDATSAANAGASLVTHVFNAMSPMHHRAPGLAGAALSDPRLTPSVIADGVHVHPAVLRLVAHAKGRGNWAVVTDAVGWRDERIHLRTSPRDGAPRLADGTIAGSATTMDAAVGYLVQTARIGLTDAVHAASTTPARVLGVDDDRGALAPGLRADLVTLDPNTLRATATWIAGEPA